MLIEEKSLTLTCEPLLQSFLFFCININIYLYILCIPIFKRIDGWMVIFVVVVICYLPIYYYIYICCAITLFFPITNLTVSSLYI